MINCKKIKNLQGENIFVESYEPRIIKGTIVLCHGITGCRKGRTMADNYFQVLANRLMDLNFKVVLFDFSGHGESEGNDYDVCLSKNASELEMILKQEAVGDVSFLAFSYGTAVLCYFLQTHVSFSPRRIAMISPCLYPNQSCFLTTKSIFGKDVVKGIENGEMDKNGYCVVGAKNFKLGKRIIEECKNFSPEYLTKFNNISLVLSGSDDVILDKSYNDEFCKKHSFKQVYLKASHSLYEEIEKAFDLIIEFFTK